MFSYVFLSVSDMEVSFRESSAEEPDSDLDEQRKFVCLREFIGVLRHMQRYFSHICDGTDVQAD